MEQPRIYCQSCGKPLRCEEDCGTNADRTKNAQYCGECYMNGEFLEEISLEKMIERVAIRMHEEMGLEQRQAAHMAVAMIPKLARWQ